MGRAQTKKFKSFTVHIEKLEYIIAKSEFYGDHAGAKALRDLAKFYNAVLSEQRIQNQVEQDRQARLEPAIW